MMMKLIIKLAAKRGVRSRRSADMGTHSKEQRPLEANDPLRRLTVRYKEHAGFRAVARSPVQSNSGAGSGGAGLMLLG
jgi:hypothetical protein